MNQHVDVNRSTVWQVIGPRNIQEHQIEYNHPLLLKDACVIAAGWFMMHQGQRTDPPWCWSGLVHVPPEMHCAWRLKRVGWPYRMWWLPCGTKHNGIDDQVCGTTGVFSMQLVNCKYWQPSSHRSLSCISYLILSEIICKVCKILCVLDPQWLL